MNQNLYDLSFCYCTKHVHHIHGPFHCFHVSDPSFTGSISALLKTRLSLMDPSTVAIQVIQHLPDFFAAQRHVFFRQGTDEADVYPNTFWMPGTAVQVSLP